MPASEVNVIVGGGQAAATAVRAMRAAGFGGAVVLISRESHLPYERPPLSKEWLLKGSAAKSPMLFDDAFYATNQVTLRLGTAVLGIDRSNQRVELSDSTALAYDRLLLATGSRPRRLPVEGEDWRNVHYLRTIEDSIAIEHGLKPGARIVIVGGGYIGLEVAACASERGCRVTVLEAGPAIMGRMKCPVVSGFVADFHRRRGVDIRTGAAPISILGRDQAKEILLATGEHLPLDMIVIGIGIEPETELAQEAGLEVDDGVLTDEHCVTSDPRIFAAGDVSKHFSAFLGRRVRLESWQNAQDQALAAGQGMAGRPAACTEVPWVWSDQSNLNLQFAGALDRTEKVVLRGNPESNAFSAFLFHGERLIGAVTVNQGRDMPLIRRMLASGRRFAEADLANPELRLKQLLQ